MTRIMSSKERALTAFARQEPDRVPINYFANPGIDRRLKEHYGIGPDDNEILLLMLGVDFRGVGAPYVGPRLHPEIPERSVDPCWGIVTRWIEHESGGYWDYCDFPLRNATVEEVEAWPMPSPDDFDYSQIARTCRYYRNYCVTMGGPGLGDIINSAGMIFSVEETLVGLLQQNEALLRYIDRRLEITLEIARRTLEAAHGGIDLFWMGEDLGTQNSPMISPELFRRLIRPRHQHFIDLAKHYNLPVMVHTCGSSSWAYDDFVEMGVSIVDTLQPEVRDMSPAYLKARYGDRLAFHGCISTAGAIAQGEAEDVREHVRSTLEVMMPGGGYALAPTHCLQDNTPTENVVALYETARKLGKY